MENWILFSLAAAAFQTIRFMLQKKLSMGTLSTGGATFSRFLYSAPFIVPLALGYAYISIGELPSLGRLFWVYAFVGGLSQILATWCVVALFQRRNFAVGITFKKTEVLLTALAGLLILGDTVSAIGLAAICLGMVGVLVLSEAPDETGGSYFSRVFNAATGLGLLSGLFFAFSAVGYRGATLEIASDDPLLRSSMALMLVTIGQVVGMLLWLRIKEHGEIARVFLVWKKAIWIGIAGMLGSLCWFTAFTLQNAAYVFAVGQVEVIFSILVSALFFQEAISRKEFLGIALVTLSILFLVVLA